MAKQPTNVLLIFCDQLRADVIGALGNPVIHTPNLDRLCAEGTAFTSAYSPCPVCVPARCCMHYGQYPQHTGCYTNGYPMPEDGRGSFMNALNDADYFTQGIGKCHFRPDPHAMRGFQARLRQEELVSTVEEDDYLKDLQANGYGYICDPHGVRSEMYYIPQVSQLPAEHHPTQWIGDRTVEFIERRGEEKQGWFCFSSYIHPHPPFTPPNPWHKLYRAPLMPLPNVPQDSPDLLTWINRHQNCYKYRAQGSDRNLVRSLKAYYYAAVSFIDYQVGRTLAALERTGQIDNTLILFTADHGELLGDYNCFGKRSMHDAAARVPLIARLPGRFEASGTCDRPVSLVDVAPTILAATGAQMPPDQLDGFDLAEVTAGKVDRDMVFSQFGQRGHAMYMALNARWKYFYSFRVSEQKQMRRALMDFLAGVGETAALDGENWKAYPKLKVPANPDSGLLVQDQPWADTSIPGYTD